MNKQEDFPRILFPGVIGLAAGATAMFFLDPDRGRRRRALVRDRVGRWLRTSLRTTQALAADVAHRARGTVLTLRRRLAPGEVEDDVLEERIRARAGHVAGSRGKIVVHAEKGRVVLEGELGARPMRALLTALRRVPGVVAVDSHMRRATRRPATQRQALRAATSAPAAGSPGPLDVIHAEQALALGGIDSDPRSTAPALEELGIRHRLPLTHRSDPTT